MKLEKWTDLTHKIEEAPNGVVKTLKVFKTTFAVGGDHWAWPVKISEDPIGEYEFVYSCRKRHDVFGKEHKIFLGILPRDLARDLQMSRVVDMLGWEDIMREKGPFVCALHDPECTCGYVD